jgi:RNA polymerase sigma factor (sigma-70 family)
MADHERLPASNSAGNSAGDWRCAWTEHQRWLRTVLFARLRNHEAVDEALQQIAIAAARSAHNLCDQTKLAPWLYRIALTTVLQHRRNAGRHKKRLRAYADTASQVDETREHDPLSWLIAKETRQLVRQALADLPGRDSEILLLKYTENWSYRELSEHLGLSTSAIEARLHRARHKLRQALAKLEVTAV